MWEAACIFKKLSLWMWLLARMEQFSFQIKSRTSQQARNRLKALKLCAIYSQSCMEVLTILGTTALMASSFRHTGQTQSLQHQNLAPWPKTAFDIAQILFATFYFIFWGYHLWTATVLFPCGFGLVASRFFSVSLQVLSQGNLRRRSLQGPQFATTGWLTNTTLSSGFCLFICGSSLSDYKLEFYNTLSAVSTALWVTTWTYNNLGWLYLAFGLN